MYLCFSISVIGIRIPNEEVNPKHPKLLYYRSYNTV